MEPINYFFFKNVLIVAMIVVSDQDLNAIVIAAPRKS